MEITRTAAMEDLGAIRKLWKVCFGDSEAFMDWYFSYRYYPAYSAVTERDGQIISAMQSCPLHVNVRGRLIAASMLAGVSTDPAWEKQGYMSRTFSHYMQLTRQGGMPLSINTPSHLPNFFSKGHWPVSDTLHFTVEVKTAPPMPNEVFSYGMTGDLAPLQLCYQQVMGRYSGSVSRTMADFALKFADYASDGAKCLVVALKGELRGYAVYYTLKQKIHAEEIVALSGADYRLLLDGLMSTAQGKQLHAKLPPDSLQDVTLAPEKHTRLAPQGVAGAADIARLLQLILGDDAFCFALEDPIVPQNQGIWTGSGQAANGQPQFHLPAGRLVQLLLGYVSRAELEEAGHARVCDRDALTAIDKKLPKQICYIVDAY